MADKNLHNFYGGLHDGITVDWAHLDIEPPDAISDTLKLTSQLKDFTGKFGHVIGGKEDCVDVNNQCQRITLEARLWEPRGRYLATIKGGSGDVTLRGRVRGHGTEVDVDLGNHSDQSAKRTGTVYLDLVHEAGEPITVRGLHARRPVLLNEHDQAYKVTRLRGFWGELFNRVYRLLKKVLPI